MKYVMYRLKFPVGVHLGEKNLDESNYSFSADTLFSALFMEAMKRGEEAADDFFKAVKKDRILLSDAFPYIDDTIYLPKPMKKVVSKGNEGDSVLKKAYKKLNYVPFDRMDEYLQGNLDVAGEQEKLKSLGKSMLKTSVAITGREETEPYHVGVYYFSENAGLYIIVGFNDTEMEALFWDLLDALSFTGIGGKKSSGIGRFGVTSQKELSADFFERENGKNGYMTLSVSLPQGEMLEEVLRLSQGYQMLERSGFVASEGYAPEQRKKNNLYVFRAGSCFTEKFSGSIYDVSSEGAHPVYRYAKPLFFAM